MTLPSATLERPPTEPTSTPTEGWPHMGRRGAEQMPYRPRDRKHLPDNIGSVQLRRTYFQRFLADHLPPAKVAALLLVIVSAAREDLADVVLTEEQLRKRIVAQLDRPRPWGWATVRSVRRVIREAERLGWLSIRDQPMPHRGIHINCYRLHIPASLQADYDWMVDNSKNAHKDALKKQSKAAQRRPAEGERPTDNPSAAVGPPGLPPLIVLADEEPDPAPLDSTEAVAAARLALRSRRRLAPP